MFRNSSAASKARQRGSTTQSITHPGCCLPQRRHRRQRVQNVAHGAQPDHKQAKLGLRVQTPIFSQGRVAMEMAQPVLEPVEEPLRATGQSSRSRSPSTDSILILDLNAQAGGFQRQSFRKARRELAQPDQILFRRDQRRGSRGASRSSQRSRSRAL
jgi:hypothetical protein